MERETILNYIINNLNNGDDEYEIERYLKIKDVDPADFESLFATARERILAEKLKTYPKRHILLFVVWTLLTIAAFALFFFILPKMNIAGSTTLPSIVGGLCLTFFAFNSFRYYKSWTKDFITRIGKPKLDLQIFIALAIIPAVILGFIISWRFSSAADQILKETQEDAVATVIDGKSVEGRKINFAEITVKFNTKEGKEIIATEDISTYQFKNFYEGQEINIVYSRENPHNIDLLIDESSIKDLKSTQEREIEPNDLINFVSATDENITGTLNKISFGWVYDAQKRSWVNEKRQNMIMKGDKMISFITDDIEPVTTFSEKFVKLGFTKISNDAPSRQDPLNLAEKLLESKEYTVILKTIVLENRTGSAVIIQKK